MKAEELMVGDWVYAIDANGEKHPCRANNLEYDYTNKRGDFCVDFYGTGYEAEWPDVAFNVEPIPITPEILEKNFGSALNGSYFEGDEFYELMILEVNDGTWIVIYDNIEFSSIPRQQVMGCFVHELQHCLKLFGIDKEIVV